MLSWCRLLAAVILLAVPAEGQDYASCGDCWCIPGQVDGQEEACPEPVPQTEWPNSTIEHFLSVELTNPYTLTCDPYEDEGCGTDPSQSDLVEMGTDAVCAVLYDGGTVDSASCPTRYSTVSYASSCEAEQAGALVTHWGACGACSTLQDLVVYMQIPDLTSVGVQCGLKLGVEKQAECYMSFGFTETCANIWVSDSQNTKNNCFRSCASGVGQDRPNNGPPPNCTYDECIQCDETQSGPLFKQVAGRTRRRSGLLSGIARPCSEILSVDHIDPCLAVNMNATSCAPTTAITYAPSPSPEIGAPSSSVSTQDPSPLPPVGESTVEPSTVANPTSAGNGIGGNSVLKVWNGRATGLGAYVVCFIMYTALG